MSQSPPEPEDALVLAVVLTPFKEITNLDVTNLDNIFDLTCPNAVIDCKKIEGILKEGFYDIRMIGVDYLFDFLKKYNALDFEYGMVWTYMSKMKYNDIAKIEQELKRLRVRGMIDRYSM